MLDKLIDWLLGVFDKVIPFEIIPHYDRGVRLRLGKPKYIGEDIKILEPGIHWKIPFVDEILSHMVKPKTMNLSEQTITTKDGQSVVVKGVIKYEVHDVATLLLEVNDAADAVADMSQGIIRTMLVERNWSECNDPELPKIITTKTRAEAKKWGVSIIAVTLTDLALMRSIRLLNSTR
jgi:regulator of protease activity HflC (stomatin/prohibitin superfamily)